jgi:pentatricopeptide repeat protein
MKQFTKVKLPKEVPNSFKPVTKEERNLLYSQVMKSIRFVESEKDSDKALKIFDVIKLNRIHIDEEYYLKIFKLIPERINSTFRIYNYMKKDGVKPTKLIFHQLLRTCATGDSSKNVERVMHLLFEDMVKWKINRTTFMFNLGLKCCSKCNDSENAAKIIEHMKENKIERDVFTYGMLIQIHSRKDDVVNAFNTFEEMKNDKVKPDVYIYNSLMTLCKNSSDNLTEISFELFRKFEFQFFKFLRMIEEDSIKPTLHSFSILLGCLRKNKEYERSILLYKELKYQEIEIDSPLMKFVYLSLNFK